MAVRLRFALMWLLLLALPIQGYAAATMLHCGPNHPRSPAAAPSAAAESPLHSAHAGHHHALPEADLSMASVTLDIGDETASAHQLNQLSEFKCSACAACCMGAALPAAALMFASFAPATAPSFFVCVEPVGFFTDGPDRPPRISLV
jgi:hypothetical protein